jgi:anti-sigma regulatory factor (Ser/Thr protein kinase)
MDADVAPDGPETGMEPSFRHEALIYAGEEEFLAGTLPFLLDGLDAGEPVLVAVGRGNAALLEEELGAEATRVHFADMEALGRNPARIIPFWQEFVDEHDGTVRGVGEPLWPSRGAHEVDECQRHESLLNVAFDHNSSWALLCSYDGAALADEVLESVAASHRAVVRNGVVEPGLAFLAEEHCFAGSLPTHPATVAEVRFDLDSLADVRRQVEAEARLAGLAPLHASDLMVAANELAANSVAHGGGAGILRSWLEADRVIVEVEDAGEIVEPLVGRIKPLVTQEGGRGLWLANQLCDLVQIRSGAQGTVVRLHMGIA